MSSALIKMIFASSFLVAGQKKRAAGNKIAGLTIFNVNVYIEKIKADGTS